MSLNILFNVPGSTKNRKRVGRGIGSGKGKTCGRGVKGQKSRSGVAIKNGGEQTPLYKKLPKRGFNSDKSVKYTLINLADIEVLVSENRIDSSKLIDKDVLVEIGFIKKKTIPVKLLGGLDKVKHKFDIKVDILDIQTARSTFNSCMIDAIEVLAFFCLNK